MQFVHTRDLTKSYLDHGFSNHRFFKEKCKQNKLVNRIVSKLNISTHIVEFVLRLNTLCILPW